VIANRESVLFDCIISGFKEDMVKDRHNSMLSSLFLWAGEVNH
jgi:hypothetical protein